MDRPRIVMNRIHSKRFWTRSRRDGGRLLLAVLVTVGAAAACTPGDSGRSNVDAERGARLTTRGAGDLLPSDFTPSPGSGGALERWAPTGPPPEEVTVESLGVDFGAPEAPVRMIEFFDYGCGYCRAFHQATRGPLHEEYVDAGQVLWKSMPFILGSWPESVPVTLAAECARDQGRDYFEAISDPPLRTSERLEGGLRPRGGSGGVRPGGGARYAEVPGPVSRTTSFCGGCRHTAASRMNSASGGRPRSFWSASE